jgi:hypothetical protein
MLKDIERVRSGLKYAFGEEQFGVCGAG